MVLYVLALVTVGKYKLKFETPSIQKKIKIGDPGPQWQTVEDPWPPLQPAVPSHKIARTACPSPQKASTNSLKLPGPFMISVKAVRISVKAGGTSVSLKRPFGLVPYDIV